MRLTRVRHASDPIAQVLGPEGLLRTRLESYESRPAQLAMARAVATTLAGGGRLVVEAGTGTGKTLAYLVPALLSELKTVISTGTRTLQEQIRAKDVPLALELLGQDGLQVLCMKGLSNYLCLRRLAEARRAPRLFPERELELVVRWAERTETGDRAELAELPEGAPVWADVCSSPEGRIGPRCTHFEDCFVTRMRRAAASARLLIVNHHLLLADLALRASYPAASVIPPCEALIIDEAHQLEAVATAFFGQSFSSATLATLARDVERATRSARGDAEPAALSRAHRAVEAGAELFHLLAEEFRLPAAPSGARGPELPALVREGEGDRHTGRAQDAGRLRLAREPFAGPLAQPYFVLDAALEALGQHLALGAAGREDWSQHSARGEQARATLALFAAPPERGAILWLEQGPRSLALHSSPIEVGPILQRTLLAAPLPIVFTSATLAVPAPRAPAEETPATPASALAYFRSRMGMAEADGVGADELCLPSPFDFARQVLLYVPRDLPHPRDAGFILRASERISQLVDITGGRALLLFTSYRHLEAARAHLRQHLDYPLLCQGEAPRSLLLERFRREVTSVLLATASFWEGVDVVGESLSLVVMDKLPFAVPDDPLTAARIELLRERGEEPFAAYQLPQAALALKQGFGRLIRHRADRGIVAVLDRRLHERGYGRELVASLPRCPLTADLLRVRAFARDVLVKARSDAV